MTPIVHAKNAVTHHYPFSYEIAYSTLLAPPYYSLELPTVRSGLHHLSGREGIRKFNEQHTSHLDYLLYRR